LAAAALIEQYDAIFIGVEETSMRGTTVAARPAMHEQYGVSVRVSALLDVDPMTAADVEPVTMIGLERGIQAVARVLPLVAYHGDANLTEVRTVT
jgi:hypothetical protein